MKIKREGRRLDSILSSMAMSHIMEPSIEEVARCKQEEDIDIELWLVLDLMNADPTPTIS